MFDCRAATLALREADLTLLEAQANFILMDEPNRLEWILAKEIAVQKQEIERRMNQYIRIWQMLKFNGRAQSQCAVGKRPNLRLRALGIRKIRWLRTNLVESSAFLDRISAAL